MTDRELLELAAKAANLNIANQKDGEVQLEQYIQKSYKLESGEFWNPLKDDGDALRLAVKLRMRIATPTSDADCAIAGIGDVRGVHIKKYSEDDITDIYEATRRAIVLAAAEIGAKL